MKTIIAITSAALFAAAAIPASAQAIQGQKITVSYADLDLSHSTGRAILEKRVEHAVDTVCAGRPMPAELSQQHQYRVCRDQAWSSARQQLARAYTGEKLAQVSIQVNGGGN